MLPLPFTENHSIISITSKTPRNDITAISILTALAAPLSKHTGLAVTRCLNAQLWQPIWAIATLANPYQHYDSTYGAQDQEQQDRDQPPVTSTQYQQLLTQEFQPQEQYLRAQAQQYAAQSFQQYGMAPMLPSQVTAPEQSYEIEHSQMVPTQVQRAMSTVSSSHYGTPQESPEMLRYQPTASSVRKRSHQSDHSYDYQGLQQLQAHAGTSTDVPLELTPHGHHAQLQSGASSYYVPSQRASPQHTYPQQSFQAMQPQTHHHHRLPNQTPPANSQRTGEPSSAAEEHGPPSIVGQSGMPAPAPRPKGPKLKFTVEDDALLVELKETKNLTWKQISDFFPGRSSGTLQVRYCTKLKAKTIAWTDEMTQKLRSAIAEYENDRWRIISGKVGNGFSAAACKEKAADLDLAEASQQGETAGETTQKATAPHDPGRAASASLASLRATDTMGSETGAYGVPRVAEGCITPVDTPLEKYFKFDVLVT